jgi:membrane protease YdiL (CAAX protease family)
MSGPDSPPKSWPRPREWLRAVWRVLLFFALFYVLAVAGTAAFGWALEDLRGPEVFLSNAVVLGAALIVGAALIHFVDRRSVGALGIAWTPRTWPEMGLGAAVGVGAIVLAALVLVAVGALRYDFEPGDPWLWLDGRMRHAWIFLVAAFAEEALFRGYPFQVLAQTFGGIAAALVTSSAFAFAHAANPNIGTFGLVNIFLAGLVLSAAYLRTRSLWFATMLHLGWNWGTASLLDLPVSGFEVIDTPFYEPIVRGPEWLTGAGFGPEGGLAGTIGFAGALAALFLLRQLQVAPEMRALQPLPDG